MCCAVLCFYAHKHKRMLSVYQTQQLRLDNQKEVYFYYDDGPTLNCKGNVHVALSGTARLDIKQKNIALNLTSKLDESNIQAKLGMQQFALPSYSFDINIDQIDLDRYTAAQTSVPKSGSPEQPLDFSILKNLNANGSLRIGSLKIANVKSKNVRMTLKSDSL